jgi:hypothetical protein
MYAVGVQLYQQAIPAAYAVCALAWDGEDLDGISYDVAVANPTWGIERAKAFVANAIIIYCPPSGAAREKRIYA